MTKLESGKSLKRDNQNNGAKPVRYNFGGGNRSLPKKGPTSYTDDEEPVEDNSTSPKAKKSSSNKKEKESKSTKNKTSRIKNKKDNKIDNDDKNSEKEEDGDKDSAKEKLSKIKNLKKKFKLMIIFGGVFIFLFIILGTILVLLGAGRTTSLNAGAATFGTEEFQSMYEKGTPEYEKEMAYYKKLDEVVNKYFKEKGFSLDKIYINSILMNYYYECDEKIDFDRMSSYIESIADLMVENNQIDYDKNGAFYNNLLNSEFFKNYYGNILNNKEPKEILDISFDMAKETNDAIINKEAKQDPPLYVQPSLDVVVPENGSSKTLNIKDYIMGSIYAGIDNSLMANNNKEKLKSYAVVYFTNLLANGNYKTGVPSIKVSNYDDGVLYCNVTLGCSKVGNDKTYYLKDGGTDASSGGSYDIYGKYYYKPPLSNENTKILKSVVDEVFGYILLDSFGTYVKLDDSLLLTVEGNTYKQILAKTYLNYKLVNIMEDSYAYDVIYKDSIVKIDAVFFDQGDYGNVKFCGRRTGTIKTSGCGTTAMAIVASTLIGPNGNDPVSMMNYAYKEGSCGEGISGTYTGFINRMARRLGLKDTTVEAKSSLYKVTDALATGKSMVVALMGSGTFTNGGHYIVLGGINGATKEVYVYDPNNKGNIKNHHSGNGWYSFDKIIAKQGRKFIIVTKG